MRMEALSKGWFSELHNMWPGQAFSLEVEHVIHSETTKYQHIVVFQRYTVIYVL